MYFLWMDALISRQVISSVRMVVHSGGTVSQLSYENHHHSVIGCAILATCLIISCIHSGLMV